MSKKMLIDAAHPEETRVVVLDGNRVEEFDFESRAKKQLRGNIYLAKVTRVEPSLQAAFVEYGGNRHGFLAFNEIHPDYYQIPHADREALMREADEDDDDHAPAQVTPATDEDGETFVAESMGGDDEDEIDEEVARRRRRLMRRYKIQEVIKRRQIMLIQVVKEERGNKGAALTTYLSLAGRYCVLMPNTDRGGGISRKITATNDRKRLRSVVADLDVPQGMGLIVRTAGAKRTKAEIKRDYEYLSRAWSNIRDTTLHSIAPALIYEEEDLVKRAIRDLFDKDIESIWVEGQVGFREARDFMRMLMPSQAKKVQAYREPTPLFVAHKVEDHLSQIYSPVAPLRSGGYLVINQTEALVAIDVNSGRATRERNVEATALKTNLEAAEEAARQLRLRDLAGLIVIDFIDMDEAKNNRAVEKVLKDCLARDRARIQVGKISSFGLMEVSRQRRRTGILEGTTHICPHCNGAGRVRSVESSALAALRAVEMEALKGGGEVHVRAPREVALYILNHKREYLTRQLRRHGLFISVVIDEALAFADYEIERISDVPYAAPIEWDERPDLDHDALDDAEVDDVPEDEADEELDDEDEAFAGDGEDEEGDETDEDSGERGESELRSVVDTDGGQRRGRRRRRGRREEPSVHPSQPPPTTDERSPEGESEGEAGRRRRRGRRGGRRPRDEGRVAETYAWSWPARLTGDDPYEWRGPVERAASAVESEPQSPATQTTGMQTPLMQSSVMAPTAEAEIDVPAPQPSSGPELADWLATPVEALALQDDEIWVELPSESKRPGRGRRGRGGRDIAADDVTTAAPMSVDPADTDPVDGTATIQQQAEIRIAEATETIVAAEEMEPPASPPESSPFGETIEQEEAAKQATPQVTLEAPPVAAAAPVETPTAVEPSVVDPAEISSPPAAPRRGWWRRSV